MGAIAGLVLVAASHGHAEERELAPRWNFMGWTPSLTATLGVHTTDISGFVRATDSGGMTIRDPARAAKSAVTGLLHFSLGVESPELPVIPGDIRVFGAVDYYVTFPPDRQAAGEGNPTGFFIKPGSPNPPEVAIEGTGSKTRIRTNQSAYGFTAGLSIPVEIAGFGFKVRPGASWMRYQWDIRGVVLDAIKPPTLFGRDFRAIELRARGNLYSNGVGPYLGIEVEPDPVGPFLVSAYVEAAYYRTLGDRDANISDSATVSGNGLPTDTYSALWGIELDDYFWRAGAGVRVYLAAD